MATSFVAPSIPSTQATDAEVAVAVSDHAALADPHAGYLLESLFDAAGDLIQGSADNTPAKLTLGSDGQELAPISGSAAWRTPASYSAAGGNPASTTNTSGLHAGLGGAATITPAKSGRVLILITGTAYNNTLLDGVTVQVRTGTGTAPINGAALTGTARGAALSMISSTANAYCAFTAAVLVTGLTVGTAYWIDVSQAAITGGVAQIIGAYVSAIEV